MARAYVSLGSNVDPERHLHAALAAMRAQFGVVDVSPVYRSTAVGFAGAAFLNCAAAFACGAAREVLRGWLHGLEDAAGRDRSLPRYADRTLDLDLALWCEGTACSTDLTREEFDRAHVLAPLADLASALPGPFDREPLGVRWRRLRSSLPAIEVVPALPDG